MPELSETPPYVREYEAQKLEATAHLDAYGIRTAAPLSEILEGRPAGHPQGECEGWLELCKQLFEERYVQHDEDVRKPLTQMWPHTWELVPVKAAVHIMRAPRKTKHGTIYIPDSAQERRGCGYIVSVSPMLLMRQTLERLRDPMPADHPLDLVGQCVLFTSFAGVELSKRVTDQPGDCEHIQLRVDDIQTIVPRNTKEIES